MRSRREDFGPTVMEAMWKRRPVIGTLGGEIRAQIRDGKSGFTMELGEDCAARIVQLVRDPQMARAIGEEARRSVRRGFLLPRLLLDDLRLYKELTSGATHGREVA